MSISIKLKMERESKGLTIEQLAKMTSISESYIRSVENGKKSPRIDILCDLAKGLGVKAEELYAYD